MSIKTHLCTLVSAESMLDLVIGKEKQAFYEKQETQTEINTSERVEWIHSEQFSDILRFYSLIFFLKRFPQEYLDCKRQKIA